MRTIVHRTRGYGNGPIVRLMSPADLGEYLKPFVFLDLFEADMRGLSGNMPMHPHSGIATVTVFADGNVTFDDPIAGHGILGYGGVEFVRAGKGMWHGKELSAGSTPTVQGFQLWIALPPELETADPDPQYVGSDFIPQVGPVRLILGSYAGTASPVRAPGGINYLLGTLKSGEQWTYEPPAGQTVGWVAVGKGAMKMDELISAGELFTFDKSDAPIRFEASADTTFVLGSAVPHPYPLHLGSHSVHTSAQALTAAERYLRELKVRLDAAGDRRTKGGTVPVFRQ